MLFKKFLNICHKSLVRIFPEKKTLVEKKNSSRDHFVINIANVVVCSPIFLSTNVGSISRLALDWEKSIFFKKL